MYYQQKRRRIQAAVRALAVSDDSISVVPSPTSPAVVTEFVHPAVSSSPSVDQLSADTEMDLIPDVESVPPVDSSADEASSSSDSDADTSSLSTSLRSWAVRHHRPCCVQRLAANSSRRRTSRTERCSHAAENPDGCQHRPYMPRRLHLHQHRERRSPADQTLESRSRMR